MRKVADSYCRKSGWSFTDEATASAKLAKYIGNGGHHTSYNVHVYKRERTKRKTRCLRSHHCPDRHRNGKGRRLSADALAHFRSRTVRTDQRDEPEAVSWDQYPLPVGRRRRQEV